MADTEQNQNNPSPLFDQVKRNLPEQEIDDDIESISVLEFIFWMLAISSGIFFIQYLYHFLF